MKYLFFFMTLGPLQAIATVNYFHTEIEYQDQDNVIQEITITGTVTDEFGEALPGVNVIVKGTTTGVATDASGRYSIKVPGNNAVLVFSFVGYASREFLVGNQRSINVRLSEYTSEIEEVVVVGYSEQKKVNLTGSVSTISSEQLENRATPNFQTSLVGLAPGLNVTQNSGNPGDENVAIRIRGLGSINGGSPMFIVDGVQVDQGSMAAINSEDVENISILKDAASAAIYGSRAANGVILITTKKGKGKKPTVTVSAMYAQQSAKTEKAFLSDVPTLMNIINTAYRNSSPLTYIPIFSQDMIDEWEAANRNPNGMYTHPVTGNTIPNWLAYPNTDWYSVLFQPTMYHRYNASVSGRSDNISHMLSIGYQDNPGTIENTGQKRFNVRVNLESKIANFLTIGTQTHASKDFKDPGSLDWNSNVSYNISPMIYPKYNGMYGHIEDNRVSWGNGNHLRAIAQKGGKLENTRISSTWFAEADIWNGISAEARFNYSEHHDEEESYTKNIPRYSFREGPDYPQYTSQLATSPSSRYSGVLSNYTADLILRYEGVFKDHKVNTFAGYEQYYWKNTAFSATKRGLMDFEVTDFQSATEMVSMGGSAKTELAILSYFGRLNYAYKNRYLFEANIRVDGSSRFAPGHRWGTFTAFSGGWRISEEPFFEPIKKYVNDLKLKASHGELGNQVSGFYSWQSIYGKKDVVLDQAVTAAIAATQLPNFQMSWEKTTTTNIGFESSFLKRRLSLEVDYFIKKTTDMLINPSVYLSVGNISLPQTNAAELTNKGFDISIGWKDTIKKMQYSIDINAGYAANEITKYYGELKYEADPNVLDVWGNPTWRYTNLAAVSTGGNNRIVEGHPYNEYYLRRPYQGTGTYTKADGSVDPDGGPKDGMIRTKADLDWARSMIAAGYSFNNQALSPTGATNYWYGEVLMADVNGDGRYGNNDDIVFTGKTPFPKWIFGATLSAQWNGIDLSMTWSCRLGSYHYILERGVNSSNLAIRQVPARYVNDYYTYDAVAAATNGGVNDYDPALDPNANFTAKFPRFNIGAAMPVSSFYLYNSSYLKLKTMQVGYSLPNKWLNELNIRNLRVFISGENMLTIRHKDYPGVDPEFGSNVNLYPMAKIFSGGVTITF
ncbi:TonB-dependent receptor [Proteiniphilum sp.]|uniref:SusC/RagA family TonB-linked outer membrane protein n=1 Tax=Proteiniphilum sp. TaxID=1926877 RepID=UPI00331C9998